MSDLLLTFDHNSYLLLGTGGVHSTSWKFSNSWKFGLYFVYIFIADWNFLTKFCSSNPSFNINILRSLFCSSNPSFNINILRSLYLKSETSVHAQLRNYSFIHTIYKFHDIVSVGNLIEDSSSEIYIASIDNVMNVVT